MATMARDYRQQPIHVSEVDDEVVALHRQNQVRQLKDTWPIDGLCIYNYQLATQIDRIFIHPTVGRLNEHSLEDCLGRQRATHHRGLGLSWFNTRQGI
jgi:hypothetical protein